MKFKAIVIIVIIAFLLGGYMVKTQYDNVSSVTEAISNISGGKNTYYNTSTDDLLESGDYIVLESYYTFSPGKFYVILEKDSKRYWISMLFNIDSNKFDNTLFEVSNGDILNIDFNKNNEYIFKIKGVDVEDE